MIKYRPPILCVRRIEPKWLNFEISKIGGNWNAIKIIETWNKTFNVSYVNFRKSLRDISQRNLSKSFGEILYVDKFLNSMFEQKNIVYAIDEDDFIIDGFKERIFSHLSPDTKIYCWNHLILDERGIGHKKTEPHTMCNGSNYLMNTPIPYEVLMRHGAASKFFMNSKRKIIKENLTLKNHNISSLSLYLNGDPTKDMMENYLIKYKETNCQGTEGFETVVEEMMELYKGLNLK